MAPQTRISVELRADLIPTRNRVWVLLVFPDYPDDDPPDPCVPVAVKAVRGSVDPLRWCFMSVGTQAFCIGPTDPEHELSEAEASTIEALIQAELEAAGFEVELR